MKLRAGLRFGLQSRIYMVKIHISHLRGMLLEEAVLYLLSKSGYTVVDSDTGDDTLTTHSAGLAVRGRGGNHQIDAIADFSVRLPFTYQQRLLVEAKCYSPNYKVGLPIIRNAVGVLKDANEFWVTRGKKALPHNRYKYNFALVSASGYSLEAEQYAIAQEIFLIPASKGYFRPVVASIRGIRAGTRRGKSINLPFDLKDLRLFVRDVLLRRADVDFLPSDVPNSFRRDIGEYFDACRLIQFGLLAMIGNAFPVFLIPSRNVHIGELESDQLVRFYYDHKSWYITDQSNRKLFSFEMPEQMIRQYMTEDGTLSQFAAATLKSENLARLHALYSINGLTRLLELRLDYDWLEQLLEKVR